MIVIPTYGRADRQKTYSNLPESIQAKTYLAVQLREAHLYASYANVIVLPNSIQDIAATRDYLVEQAFPKKLIMLDDDLQFATRRTDDQTKFVSSTAKEIESMFIKLYTSLQEFAHSSVSAREGANYDVDEYKYNDRAMRILAYDTRVLAKENILFAPYTFMCDFGVTLELMQRGHENIIINKFVNNQAGSDVTGGCSSQRTPQLQQAAAEYLASKFPKYVRVVQKTTKVSWNGNTRYDVRCQWKKCAADGVNSALLDGRARIGENIQGAGITQTLE